MIVRKAYKYRLKTNNDVEQKLWSFAGLYGTTFGD